MISFEVDNGLINRYQKAQDELKSLESQQRLEWIKFVVKAFQCSLLSSTFKPKIKNVWNDVKIIWAECDCANNSLIVSEQEKGWFKPKHELASFHWNFTMDAFNPKGHKENKKAFAYNYSFLYNQMNNNYFKYKTTPKFESLAPELYKLFNDELNEKLTWKLSVIEVEKSLLNKPVNI
jgi:hypothetical protein